MLAMCAAFLLAAMTPTDVDFNFGWSLEANGRTETVDLPHDFLINVPWDKSASAGRGFKPVAEGVYRKTFTAPEEWKGNRVLLDFAGVQSVCDVSVNGKALASFEYGYLGFEVDLAPALKWGGVNTIEVKCATGSRNGARWYTGCGICRRVSLKVRGPIAFERHGLYVSTPVAEKECAVARLVADVLGWTARTNGSLVVRARVFDPKGVAVAKVERPVGYDKRRVAEILLPDVTLPAPQLWSLETPRLYRAECELVQEGRVVDRIVRRFGVRQIAYSPEFGFRLNGEKVFLKGMSNHQDLGALGVASFSRAWRRQIAVMKAFGYNAIRCSHNPYPEELLDACDEMGLLVVDELVDKWRGIFIGRRPFAEQAPALVKEWVRRDRSHPCVILWSLGNETQHAEYCLPFEYGDWGVTEYRVLDALVKRWDATRPTTVAMFPSRAGGVYRNDGRDWATNPEPPELSRVTEVASFNYVFENYAEYVRRYPQLIVFQSEAACAALATPFFTMDLARMVGCSYWGAISYWGESDGWPKKGWNYSFFDRTLDPFPQAYLLRGAFDESVPCVRIGVRTGKEIRVQWNDVDVGRRRLASHWNFPAGPRGVDVFFNTDEVELFLNGRSLGARRNDRANPKARNHADWPSVDYAPGTLLAVARSAGREIARHELKTAGRPVRLVLEEEFPGDWKADGHDLKYIRLQAVDAAGVPVPDAADEVSVSLAGGASLVALDDGDSYTDRLFNISSKRLFHGRLLAILRADRTPGTVRFTATAPFGSAERDLVKGPQQP